MGLGDERCGACDRDTPRLDDDTVRTYLAELDPAWSVTGDRLTRTWRFPDFAQGLALVNAIGAIAESEGHHPDLWLAWGRVRVELQTHAIGGLSRADFVLAAKVDALR